MENDTVTIWTDYPNQSTSYVQVESSCSYCGRYHEGTCPRVEELEYYPDGTLKRVRLRAEPVREVGVLSPLPVRLAVGCPDED